MSIINIGFFVAQLLSAAYVMSESVCLSVCLSVRLSVTFSLFRINCGQVMN